MSKKQQFLVEFQQGAGWTYDTHREALLCACEIVLERAARMLGDEETDPKVKQVINWVASGDLGAALDAWNDLGPAPIIIRKVSKRHSEADVESLKATAARVLETPKPIPPMSLAAAIAHARNQAKVLADPRCRQEHQQLADWLEDLHDLYQEIQEWRAYADEGVSWNEALIDVVSNLRGYYE